MSDRQHNNWRGNRRAAQRQERLADFIDLPAEPLRIRMEDGRAAGLEEGMDMQLYADCGARVRLFGGKLVAQP